MNDSPCLGENEWHCFEKTGESVMEKRREEEEEIEGNVGNDRGWPNWV